MKSEFVSSINFLVYRIWNFLSDGKKYYLHKIFYSKPQFCFKSQDWLGCDGLSLERNIVLALTEQHLYKTEMQTCIYTKDVDIPQITQKCTFEESPLIQEY